MLSIFCIFFYLSFFSFVTGKITIEDIIFSLNIITAIKFALPSFSLAMFPSTSLEKKKKLFSAYITRFVLVFSELLYFDWLISAKLLSPPFPCLISRQSLCKNSDSVVYSDMRGKIVMPENLYKNVLTYILHQECSDRIGQQCSFTQ